MDFATNQGRQPSFIFFLRIGGEFDALCLEGFRRGENVIAPESHRLETADASFASFRREERDPGFRARYDELGPALMRRERLVGQHLEAKFFRVELQGRIPVANRDADDFYSPYY